MVGQMSQLCVQEMCGWQMRLLTDTDPQEFLRSADYSVHENSRTWVDVDPALKKHDFGQVLTVCKMSLSHCTISR